MPFSFAFLVYLTQTHKHTHTHTYLGLGWLPLKKPRLERAGCVDGVLACQLLVRGCERTLTEPWQRYLTSWLLWFATRHQQHWSAHQSLHFTSHTTGHLHYKPARTSRWLSLNGTYSILWSHKYGYTWIWIIYHIYRRLAAGATYLYRIRHINYNSDKKTILYTGKSYALQISSQRNFSCDVLLVRMYTGLCRRLLTVWRVKNPSSFPITGTGDIDSPKSLTTVPVAKVTLSVP